MYSSSINCGFRRRVRSLMASHPRQVVSATLSRRGRRGIRGTPTFLRFGPEDNNTKSEATSGPASRDPADKLNTWWGDMLFFKQRLLRFRTVFIGFVFE